MIRKIKGYLPTLFIVPLCFLMVVIASQIKPMEVEVKAVVDSTDMLSIMNEIEAEKGEEIYNSITIAEEDIEEAKKQLPSTKYLVVTDKGSTILDHEIKQGEEQEQLGVDCTLIECREATEEEFEDYIKYMLTYSEYVNKLTEEARKVYSERVNK